MNTIVPDITNSVKQEKNDTIIRVVHNRENPFVQLNKKALWDKKLSLKAVGLWARCMSFPNDWKFSISHLASLCKEGRKAIDSAMKELVDAGYALRMEFAEKDEKGKFVALVVEYVFFEFPATDEEKAEQEEIFKKSFRYCRFGNFRRGNFQKDKLLRMIPKKTDKKRKREREGASPPPPPPSPSPFSSSELILRAPMVKTTNLQHEELVKEFGEEVTKSCYEILSEYKANKIEPNCKNNDFITIKNWVIDRYYEQIEKKAKREKRIKTISAPENNKKYAEAVSPKVNNNSKVHGFILEIYGDCVELYKNKQFWKQIAFKENGFKEQLDNLLEKTGIT